MVGDLLTVTDADRITRSRGSEIQALRFGNVTR
jgi:hypothetical protein